MANRMALAMANRMAKLMANGWQNDAPNPNPNPNPNPVSAYVTFGLWIVVTFQIQVQSVTREIWTWR